MAAAEPDRAALAPRHATRPRPTCAPAPAGAWPGAAHPDAAAAAGGLPCSLPLRRTERPARRGGAQRSLRNPFVWLKRRDVMRRPNRRLAKGGAEKAGIHSASFRAFCSTSGAGPGKSGGLKEEPGEASAGPQVVEKSESSNATCRESNQTLRLVRMVMPVFSQ